MPMIMYYFYNFCQLATGLQLASRQLIFAAVVGAIKITEPSINKAKNRCLAVAASVCSESNDRQQLHTKHAYTHTGTHTRRNTHTTVQPHAAKGARAMCHEA